MWMVLVRKSHLVLVEILLETSPICHHSAVLEMIVCRLPSAVTHLSARKTKYYDLKKLCHIT